MTESQRPDTPAPFPEDLRSAWAVFRRRLITFLVTAGLIGLAGGYAALQAAGSNVDTATFRTGVQLGHTDGTRGQGPGTMAGRFASEAVRTHLRHDLVRRGRERAEAQGASTVSVSVPDDGGEALVVLKSTHPREGEEDVRRTHEAVALLLIEAHRPRYERWLAAEEASRESEGPSLAEPTQVLYLAAPSSAASLRDDPALLMVITVLMAGLGGLFAVFLVDFIARARHA